MSEQHVEQLQPAERPQQRGMITVEEQRAIQEIQASMIVARRFPRDVVQAINRIEMACQRKGLAEKAFYAYPRGKEIVEGPTIRLLECIAQEWGNIRFGIQEVEQAKGYSVVRAFAHDLESNTVAEKTFQVPHKRFTRNGSYPITDARDIYELVANQGARRMRSCLEGVIPRDVREGAEAQCRKTLAGNTKEPLPDRVRKLARQIEVEFGVPTKRIADRFETPLQDFTHDQFSKLHSIYTALKEEGGRVDEFFGKAGDAGEKKSGEEQVKQAFGKGKEQSESGDGGAGQEAPPESQEGKAPSPAPEPGATPKTLDDWKEAIDAADDPQSWWEDHVALIRTKATPATVKKLEQYVETLSKANAK